MKTMITSPASTKTKGTISMSGIFDVDKKGLAKLLERRGLSYLLYELWQNAVDAAGVSVVNIRLEPVPGVPKAKIEVEDDSPNGFSRLSDAWTLFAESEKKANPTLRGRYNLGEKLVIAVCDDAEIVTTLGGVRFDHDGRHALRENRPSGSIFTGVFRATRQQLDEICDAATRLIVPQGLRTVFNGKELERRTPVAFFEETLQTEIADDEGMLRRVTRKSRVDIYEPLPGEVPSVYEMGIPIVETNDKFHYDVQQKVPLTFERDNVPPAYLRALRTFALNATFSTLNTEDANQSWARDAAADKRASDDAVRTMVDKRFGEKRVSYDPSDPEANSLAFSQGFTVVKGSQASAEEWDNYRRAGAVVPAGKVTPSPKPYSKRGRPEDVVNEADWTADMRKTASYAMMLAFELMQVAITIKMTRAGKNFKACYGGRELTFNLDGSCTPDFFKDVGSVEMDDLLIHEFGHEYCSDHLSADYHQALTRLGAKLKTLALNRPELFKNDHTVIEANNREG